MVPRIVAGQLPNGRTPSRYPGTKVTLVAQKGPAVVGIDTQCPAVRIRSREKEVTTVAEQLASMLPYRRKSLPWIRYGYVASRLAGISWSGPRPPRWR